MFIEQTEINPSYLATPMGPLKCIGKSKRIGSKYARIQYCGMPH